MQILLLKEAYKMAGSFTEASSKSLNQFNILKPELIKAINNYRYCPNCVDILNIESEKNALDIFGGIDALGLTLDHCLFGIGLRIQTGKCYQTFTVRMQRQSGTPTEYEKRMKTLLAGDHYLRPEITVQAYFSNDTTLTAFAVIATSDLWLKIATGEYEHKHTGDNQYGQADFAVVNWSNCLCKIVNIKE